jgi:hypothetical protein
MKKLLCLIALSFFFFQVSMAQNVGINTVTPVAGLHILSNNGVIAKGDTMSNNNYVLAETGPGAKLIWHPKKAALIAGLVDGNPSNVKNWDEDSIGFGSMNLGYSNKVKGYYSFATGIGNVVSGGGFGSIAMGHGSLADSNESVAIGFGAEARARQAIAIGTGPQARGQSSFATGYISQTYGFASTAGGFFSVAKGDHSFSNGYVNYSGAPHSFTAGIQDSVFDFPSPEGGARSATAFGWFNKVRGAFAFTAGSYNTIDSAGYNSFTMGFGNRTSNNEAIAMGNSNVAAGRYSAAIGQYDSTKGTGSIALGYGNKAFGEYSTAIGVNSKTENIASMAIGNDILSTGFRSMGFGNGISVYGENSMGIGSSSNIGVAASPPGAQPAFGFGSLLSVPTYSAMAIGFNAQAQQPSSFSLGNGTVATRDSAFAIGNRCIAGARGSMAVGYEAITQNGADHAIALGKNARSFGAQGMAIGAYAQNDCVNCIVLGSINGINSAGSSATIGIGTTSPVAALDVWKTNNTTAAANFKGTLNYSHFMFGSNEDTYIRGGKNGSIVSINDIVNGKTGVGTSAPITTLHMKMNSTASPDGIMIERDASNKWIAGVDFANDYSFYIFNGSSYPYRGYIDHTSGQYFALSDERLKTDIESIGMKDGLQKIMQLRPVRYHFAEGNHSKYDYGFLSQEVEQIFPDFVNEKNGVKMLGYNNFIPVLASGVQELQQKIERLEKENELLKERLFKIESLLTGKLKP